MKSKKLIITFLFLLFCYAGITPVFAAEINTPEITGVEYPNATSLKVKYKTNNTNSNYKVFLYNMTSNDIERLDINTTNYTFTGLATGKVYNIKMRVYYIENGKAYTSEWSNTISAAPRPGDITINSITAGDKKATLNYTVAGSANGVEIYISPINKTITTKYLKKCTITSLTNGKTYTMTMRTYYGTNYHGPWGNSKSVTPKASTVTPTPTPKPKPEKPFTLKLNFYKHKFTTPKKNIKRIKPVPSAPAKITYRSTNSKVATVSNKGLIKSRKAGKATIIVTAKKNGSKLSKVARVKVVVTKKGGSKIPVCSLTYSSKTDKLKFKSTKYAKKYSIVKKGNRIKYSSKKHIYYPGSDRVNSTASYVNITYFGYVKNEYGITGKCKLKVKVSKGAAAAAWGKRFVGYPYCHGTNPKRWQGTTNLVCTDCSGFTAGVYRHLGVKDLSANDDVQCARSYAKTYKVAGRNSTKGAKVGDIICYPDATGYKHVAIYLGDGKKIHSPHPGSHIKIDSLRGAGSWKKIVRVRY